MSWPYPPGWYVKHTEEPLASASRAVGRAISRALPETRKALDIGCGVGTVLAGYEGHRTGNRSVGVDHPEAVTIVRRMGLWGPSGPLVPFDLERIDLRGFLRRTVRQLDVDLVICLETAEHLSDYAGRRLVSALTESRRPVVWSAAIPGQGGEEHINERPMDYWQEIFRAGGYRRLPDGDLIVRFARSDLTATPWYRRIVVYGSEGE